METTSRLSSCVTIAETTEAARRMVERARTYWRKNPFGEKLLAAALAQAFVDAGLSADQVERIESTVQRFFE